MHPVIQKCPICGEELIAARLECRACGTEINGQFTLGRLARLDDEEIQFVEMFLKNRGNAYKVGEEMGLPYSTVRAHLTEVIRSMGYEPGADSKEDPTALVVPPEKRKAILEEVGRGQISADEAIRLLQGEPAA